MDHLKLLISIDRSNDRGFASTTSLIDESIILSFVELKPFVFELFEGARQFENYEYFGGLIKKKVENLIDMSFCSLL